MRLDGSRHDDLCRVRSPNGLRILGRLSRLTNSRLIAWRQRQPNPQPKFTTDFQTAMGETNLVKAMDFVTTKRRNL